MPRIKVTRGSGITAYETTVCSPHDPGFQDFFDENADGWNNSIKKEGSIFGAVSSGAAQTCRQILETSCEEMPFIEDTPEDFANEIIRLIAIAKGEIESSNADLAARYAWLGGLRWGFAIMKWKWEKDALRGEKVIGGPKNSAQLTNESHAELRDKRKVKIEELLQNMGLDKAAAVVASDPDLAHGATWEAIKRQYNRAQKREKQGQKRDT